MLHIICAVETGACFIVFNVPVNQKTPRAHCSIVEDGILVRLPRHSFDAIHTALHTGENFTVIDSDATDGAGIRGEELVIVRWIDDASCFDLNDRWTVILFVYW